MWTNISIPNFTKFAFNKGCSAFINNKKLYLMGGQLQSYKFSDNILVFDIM